VHRSHAGVVHHLLSLTLSLRFPLSSILPFLLLGPQRRFGLNQADFHRLALWRQGGEEEEEEEGLFKADAVNEEDPERDRATQV